MAADLTSSPKARHERRAPRGTISRAVAIGGALLVALAIAVATPAGVAKPASAAGKDEVRILAGVPATLDPAAQGDIGSAAVSAQLFESITAVDPGLTVRPALAASWDVLNDGRRIVFHLRDGLMFSDGSPLRAEDVVRSWLRIIDPSAPSPLSSLLLDVTGAKDYLARRAAADSVGLKANGNDVQVDLDRPASDFPSIVAGPSFAVVPQGVATGTGAFVPGGFVGSGAYVLTGSTDTELTLTANDRYWAGRPAITAVHLIGDVGGRSPVSAFEDGDLDYAPIADFDASWISYDRTLGPQLRQVPSLSVEYYGFDTSRPPFDHVKVRQAFAKAVDWRRIVQLATPTSATPATSMVPPGIPGRSDRDFLPARDPDAARALLAEAGYPGGRGFPSVTLIDPGSAYTRGVVAELKRELGVTVDPETMDFNAYFTRLAQDPPQMWSLSWVADYPGQNDFLGVLLGTGQSNDYGRWSSAEFDRAIGEAGQTTDPATASAAFERAQAVVQRDAPVVPVAYAPGWALSRDGLLGAGQNGLGILRLASLAWQQ